MKSPLLRKLASLQNVQMESVRSTLDSLEDELCSKGLSDIDVATLLSNSLSRFGVTLEPSYGSESSGLPYLANAYLVGARIDTHTRIITIQYEPGISEHLEDCSTEEFREFRNAVCNLVSHELTHREQIESVRRSKNNEYDSDQALLRMDPGTSDQYRYLSSPHEISANARMIVEELINRKYTKNEILDGLKTKKGIKDLAVDSDTLWMYVDSFSENGLLTNSAPLKSLISRIHYFLA